MNKYDIDIIDTVKKTIEVIYKCQENFDDVDDFINVDEYLDTGTYTNSVCINKKEITETPTTDDPVVQDINITRYASGMQTIEVNNYVYEDKFPIVVESAPDVDVIINQDEDEDDDTETDEDDE